MLIYLFDRERSALRGGRWKPRETEVTFSGSHLRDPGTRKQRERTQCRIIKSKETVLRIISGEENKRNNMMAAPTEKSQLELRMGGSSRTIRAGSPQIGRPVRISRIGSREGRKRGSAVGHE